MIQTHLPKLRSKVEAYANAILTNRTTEIIAEATGKSHIIRLVHKHLPTNDAARVLTGMSDQLQCIGVGFEHTLLPLDY